MNRKIFALIMCLSAVLSFTGCTFGNNNNIPAFAEPEAVAVGQDVSTDEDEKEGPTLSVQINKSAATETDYSDITVGDELYNGFQSTVTVKSVSEKKIVLSLTGCLVEPNAGGSIDLRKEPLKEVTLKKGEEIVLKSQTMDAGVKLTISYR